MTATIKSIDVPKVIADPLKFRDQKKYADRLKDAQNKSKRQDAIIVAEGTVGTVKTVIAVFDFGFMGGSMGMGVGEAIVTAAKRAVATKSALEFIFARFRRGADAGRRVKPDADTRTIIAANQVKAAGLPFIVIRPDPTTGEFTASFAMVGDIHIAERGAQIGFAGARVIESTIRETLPPGASVLNICSSTAWSISWSSARICAIRWARPAPVDQGEKTKSGVVTGPVPPGAQGAKAHLIEFTGWLTRANHSLLLRSALFTA